MNESEKIKRTGCCSDQEHEDQAIAAGIVEEENASTEISACVTLKADLIACQKSLDEWKDTCARIGADFENYKKRTIEQQKMWVGTAQADIFSDILVIIDDFERAIAEKRDNEVKDMSAWVDGIVMIYNALQKMLVVSGVEEIVDKKEFNPVYHEALINVDSDEYSSGEVVAIFQKGYTFKGKVLRPAKVSVAK